MERTRSRRSGTVHSYVMLSVGCSRVVASRTKAPEAGPDFADQDLGLLKGCEVSALVGLAVVNQVGVGVFDPASGEEGDVTWEHRHRDWQSELRAGKAAGFVLPVDAGGRRGTVCKPVERDRVEHVIDAEGILGEPVIAVLDWNLS